ncbi:MAG: 8-amino-7-oxononanoate synthase, partial [Candidatus Paceibacteria bacterium]
MTPGLAGELRGELDLLAEAGLARTLELQSVIERAADFTSNDYLGLALHPEVIAASQSALAEFGAGARASRLLGGGSPLESLAEERLAEWVETETALLFPTGFQANLGLITSLAGSGDLLLCDARIHASMIDACRLTKAQRRIFAHNDLQQLAQALVHSRGARRRIVLVESIYSMDGDLAPLAPIAELCEQHDAWMVVDEAHAIGVCGARGAGLVAELSPRHCARVLARVMTGGKALGCGGGFVASSKEVREQL